MLPKSRAKGVGDAESHKGIDTGCEKIDVWTDFLGRRQGSYEKMANALEIMSREATSMLAAWLPSSSMLL